MIPETIPCYCCSGKPFRECCEPILRDRSLALTPEALMRSRYSAYVLEREDHLLATWDPTTRPSALALGENRVKWLGLLVHSEKIQPAGNNGEVSFTARYLDRDQLCLLKENSRFVRTAGRWYYLDGAGGITREKLSRNSLCPCGSGKKFKRCCLAV